MDHESSWLSRVIWFSKLHSDEHTRVSTGCMAAEGRLYLVKSDTRLSSKWVNSLVDWIEKCTQVINLALKTFKYKRREGYKLEVFKLALYDKLSHFFLMLISWLRREWSLAELCSLMKSS